MKSSVLPEPSTAVVIVVGRRLASDIGDCTRILVDREDLLGDFVNPSCHGDACVNLSRISSIDLTAHGRFTFGTRHHAYGDHVQIRRCHDRIGQIIAIRVKEQVGNGVVSHNSHRLHGDLVAGGSATLIS